ncbi:MAG TPA: tetratricopeptide repeat protein [Tepidisphaeraceae bacterium]|nr:tetratricopeptide repeat protein [Tepidisphaeraceae bacterium]
MLSSVAGVIGLAGTAFFIQQHRVERRGQIARIAGEQALKEGRYFDALQGIGTYLQHHGNNAQALYEYGQAREHVEEPNGKNYVEATSFYNHALSLRPDLDDARHALLKMYLKLQFNTETINTADTILSKNSEDVDALGAKAIALYRTRKFKESLTVAKIHDRLAPADFEIQDLTLDLLNRDGKTPQQLVEYTDSLRKAQHDDPRTLLLEAIACRGAGDNGSALSWMHKAAAAPFINAAFTQAIIGQLDRFGLFSESLPLLKKVADSTSDPILAAAYISRLWQGGQAQTIIDRLASVDPAKPSSNADLLGMRAMALLSMGRRGEADTIIRALNARQGDGTALAWASVLPKIYPAGAKDEAQIISTCRAALRIAPNNPYIHAALAEASAGAGEYESAAEQFQIASQLAPAWNAPLLRASQMLTRIGRIDQAVKDAQAGRLRAPDDIEAMVTLAMAADPVVRSPQGTSARDLLKLVNQIQERVPFENRTLPVQVRLMAMTGGKDAAISRSKAALARQPLPNEECLLALASVSQRAGLGLGELIFDASRNAYGQTPDLSLAEAMWHFNAGDARQGLAVLNAARAKHTVGDAVQWRLVRARYLDLIADPSAKSEWESLGNDQPGNTRVQWLVLSARSVQPDHAFIGQTLDRLRAAVGEEGLTLKLARAQWLLQANAGQKEALEASVLLNEVSRTAPDLLAPHMLLATCLERIGNVSGAIEQLTTASDLQPNSNAITLELARLLESQGNFDQAETRLNRIVQNNLMTPVEREQVAALLTQAGDVSQGLAVASGGSNTEPTLLQAHLLRLSNQNDKAEAIYQKLLEKPDAAVIDAAIDFYLSQGRNADAQKASASLDEVKAPADVKELVRAGYYRRINSVQSAIEHYQSATKINPSNENAWRQLIVYCLEADKVDLAIESARSAAQAIPSSQSFRAVTANAGLVKNDFDEIAARPIEVALVAPGSVDDLPDTVETLQIIASAKQSPAPAQQLLAKLRAIADRRPKLLSLQNYLIQAYMLHGRLDDAIAVATRTMQAFPTEVQPVRLAAEALAKAGRWTEAVNIAQTWKQRAPQEAMAADALVARSNLASNQPQRAIEILKPYISAAQSSPNSTVSLNVLGNYAQAQIAAGQVQQAEATLEPTLAKSPQCREAWMALASQTITDSTISSTWLEHVEPLIDKNSFAEMLDLTRAWTALAGRESQYSQRADDILAKAAAFSSSATRSEAPLVLLLAMFQEQRGDAAAAEENYRKTLALDPTQAIAMNNLAMIVLRNHGDLNEAMQLAAGAVKEKPNVPAFYDTLATIQATGKDYPKAINSMNSALLLQPDNIMYQVNLASILATSGQPAKARLLLDKIDLNATPSTAIPSETRAKLTELRRTLAGKA